MGNAENKQGKKKKIHRLTGRDLKASTLGWELALPIVLSPVGGHFLDLHFDTKPLLTIIGFLFGLLTGGYFLIKFMIYESYELRERNKEDKKDGE